MRAWELPFVAIVAASAGCAVAGPQGTAAGPDAMPSQSGADASVRSDAPPPSDGSSGVCAYTGVLATWTFTTEPGSQNATAASSSASGVTAGSLTRASALTASTGASSMNSSNWATGAQIDPSKYYSLTISPGSGCGLDIGSIAIDMKSSSTGPTMAAVATSADAYAQTTSVSPNAAGTGTLAVTNASSSVEIRIFGFGASGATGTMRVQNTLTVSGTVH